MVTLEYILNYLETHCALRVVDPCDRKREIGQVELLGEYTVFTPEALYLDPREPACLYLWEGETLRPLHLTGVGETGRIYRTIRQLLDDEVRLSDQINRMYRMLSVTGGLKAVIEAAEEYLHYPISVLDASYNMMEVSPKMQKLEYGIKKVQSRMVLDSAEIESLKRLQIEKKIYENQIGRASCRERVCLSV